LYALNVPICLLFSCLTKFVGFKIGILEINLTGFIALPFSCSSKCKCAPLVLPLLPI
jgi:hypothetical protein